MPPGGYAGFAVVLGKYDALYRVMAKAFGLSAFEVNRMTPWECASALDIQPETEGIRRVGRPAHLVNPREERATPEERERAAEFRRQLIAAQQAGDD